jgi:hypothetical protein
MGRLAKVAYGVTFACSVVSWIVLLSGNGEHALVDGALRCLACCPKCGT